MTNADNLMGCDRTVATDVEEHISTSTASVDHQDLTSQIQMHMAHVGDTVTTQSSSAGNQNTNNQVKTQDECKMARPACDFFHKQPTMILKYPRTPRNLSVLLLLVLFILDPLYVALSAVMTLNVMLLLAFVLGPDRIHAWTIAWYKDLKQRDPDKAERVRMRAASASRRLSNFVETLPNSWTTGLYLPDFEEPGEVPQKFSSDPFDKLIAQKEIWISPTSNRLNNRFFDLACLSEKRR